MLFYSYPLNRKPSIEGYVLLSVDAPKMLSKEEGERGLLLLDGTWKLAEKMERALEIPGTVVRRSLPPRIVTAYPRRQEEPDGLASVEALYVAYLLMGRNPEGVLDHYRWRTLFLEKNSQIALY